ncbi:HUS1 [Branchiostoma lanceolatum]|uniref:HUS1 protein n=1 Tax=Branchiostoma lanceolatum TaxID=7740 RepID=A0A8J9YTS1_BRALA|nr:HUS1 [Branchiostoma lanceolatum]
MSANRNGDMTLKVETDMAEVTTLFRDLEIPSWSREEESGVSQSDRDPEEMAEARVDIRKFSQFLAGQQVNPDRVICSDSEKDEDLSRIAWPSCRSPGERDRDGRGVSSGRTAAGGEGVCTAGWANTLREGRGTPRQLYGPERVFPFP